VTDDRFREQRATGRRERDRSKGHGLVAAERADRRRRAARGGAAAGVGAARALGDDAHTSAADQRQMAHPAPTLGVLGASSLPTTSSCHPTETVEALAMAHGSAPGRRLRVDRRRVTPASDVVWRAASTTRVLWLAVVVLSAVMIAACGGDGDDGAEPTPTRTEGDAGAEVAGRQVFTDTGCGSCHTLAAADANGTTGPNLDETAAGDSAEQIRTSIIEPNAEITEGFRSGVMPQNYEDRLTDEELNALAEFIASNAGN
jgi:mono/diheme cytochrome c family protein